MYENDCIIDKRTYTLIKGENHSIIPDYVKIIGEYAFANCLFETIQFPKSLKRIEKWAFCNCPNLLYVTIPSNVEFIGGAAFDVPNIMTVIFDGFDGILEDSAFAYHSVYTDIVCEDYWTMDRPFGDLFGGKFESKLYALYNTTLKEDDGKKYVYSLDLKNILLPDLDIGYAICYREGYKFLGWSFTENSNEVDIPVEIVERYIYDEFGISEIRKFYGFAKSSYLEKQKEHDNGTILYTVWEKI